MERKGLAVVFVLAAAIRLSIFSSAEFREAIAARVEVPARHEPPPKMMEMSCLAF